MISFYHLELMVWFSHFLFIYPHNLYVPGLYLWIHGIYESFYHYVTGLYIVPFEIYFTDINILLIFLVIVYFILLGIS